MLKLILRCFLLPAALLLAPAPSDAAAPAAGGDPSIVERQKTDPWKGTPSNQRFGLAALAGIGVLDGSAFPGLLGAVSVKIVHRGFSPEINNQVFLEVAGGPLFGAGGTAVAYSAHLRWDFNMDVAWTFYGIGGLGGTIHDPGTGLSVKLFPRFGLGTIVHLAAPVDLRAEASHEFTTVGIQFNI